MTKQFTKEQAKMWAGKMIQGKYTKVSIFTDGKVLRLMEGGDTNVVAMYALPKGKPGQKNGVLRVNPTHFVNRSGKILKGELTEFLYKEINSLIESHQKDVQRKLVSVGR